MDLWGHVPCWSSHSGLGTEVEGQSLLSSNTGVRGRASGGGRKTSKCESRRGRAICRQGGLPWAKVSSVVLDAHVSTPGWHTSRGPHWSTHSQDLPEGRALPYTPVPQHLPPMPTAQPPQSPWGTRDREPPGPGLNEHFEEH